MILTFGGISWEPCQRYYYVMLGWRFNARAHYITVEYLKNLVNMVVGVSIHAPCGAAVEYLKNLVGWCLNVRATRDRGRISRKSCHRYYYDQDN